MPKPASSSPTPPLLTSPSWRGSSIESTPISTPVTTAYHYPSRSAHDPDAFAFSAAAQRKRPYDHHFSDDELLFPPDEDETALPLFPSASPHPASFNMANAASPIDIATMRQTSTSPRNQQSNLTSQLMQPKIDVREDITPAPLEDSMSFQKDRQESVGMLDALPQGARTIPGREPKRRESSTNAISSSAVNGMSWGGISMGSFIRDDMMMTGTSPYNFGSPSLHSSSYLPKMEANYMKDYVCCDIRLDSMHELLQHYEEAHATQPNQTLGRAPRDLQFPSSRAANAASASQAVQQQQAQQVNLPQQPDGVQPLPTNPSPLFGGSSHEQIGTFDHLDDMEMDESIPSAPPQQQPTPQIQPQPQFGRQQPRGHSVNVNVANAFQTQGLNSSTPTTPHATQQVFQNNPTVSSVNTPSLSTQTPRSQPTATPDSSMPGSPGEPNLNLDYRNQMENFNIDYNQLMQGNTDFSSLSLNHNQNGGSGTIDDPAKRLLSKQGYATTKGFGNHALANAGNSGSGSELAKRVREQQLLNGLSGAGGFVGEEIKPFKCPVIGCEKAYKNQNGLKYHKQHGHQNQQLKENADGTFSIVDPATSIPYPGTVGMEKEKPYRCEVCGKRYKNLNGLKYHRQHSPQCNPELKLGSGNVPGVAGGNLQGLGVNVAGAGLLGLSDGLGY